MHKAKYAGPNVHVKEGKGPTGVIMLGLSVIFIDKISSANIP